MLTGVVHEATLWRGRLQVKLGLWPLALVDIEAAAQSSAPATRRDAAHSFSDPNPNPDPLTLTLTLTSREALLAADTFDAAVHALCGNICASRARGCPRERLRGRGAAAARRTRRHPHGRVQGERLRGERLRVRLHQGAARQEGAPASLTSQVPADLSYPAR